MEACLFSQINKCKDPDGPLTTAGKQRIESIIRCSKTYEDCFEIDLQAQIDDNEDYSIQCHRKCVSYYTSRDKVERFLKRKQQGEGYPDSHVKRRRRSDNPTFSFLKHCIFCGLECNIVKDERNPARWRKAYVCRTGGDIDFKGSILRVCAQRNDKQADEVRTRIQGAVSDLHAADARYHVDCRAKFMTPRNSKCASATTSNTSLYSDDAFLSVVADISNNKTHIWNAVEVHDLYIEYGGVTLQRKTLVKNIQTYFGNDMVILHSPGLANMLVFRSNAPNLMTLVSISEDDDLDVAVNTIAKQITKETKLIEIDKDRYNTRINSDVISGCVSDTVIELLAKLSTKLNRTNTAYMIGNIITAVVKNKPTALQIALGVMMRESKSIINQLHEFNITCSYSELLLFKKSAAVSATENVAMKAVSNCNVGMIQTIVDNFDADIASQNGKVSTHSLAMLMTQNVASSNEEPDLAATETIQRIPWVDNSKQIEYEVDIERYRGPKKPPMPAEEAKKHVLPLKMLASKVISSNRAKETDFCFLENVITCETCPEYNGYNTRLSREQGHTKQTKTKADYLPLIDMKPSDPDTVMTALRKSQVLASEYGQEFTVFTADLQLYRVAVNVLWAYPEQFDNVVLRLGGMHLLMSFVGSVGTLMANSGLEELLESSFAGVPKMLSGKKYPQNVRALRIVTEELLRNAFSKGGFEGYDDLDRYLNMVAHQSRTAKLWVDCLIRAVFLMMLYVRAEREADWPLHLAAVQQIIPYFFAAGHHNYARYGLYYLRSMEAMPGNVRDKFMKGEHVMRHLPGVWNAIWSDMYIETTFMRYGHGKKGIIGITLKPETLKVWSLSLHICSRMEEDLRQLSDADGVSIDDQHKEEKKARINADNLDKKNIRKKLEQSIDPLDTSKHPKNLVNVVTGTIAPETVNADRAIEIGTSQMNEFESSWPEKFYGPIARKVETQAVSKKHIKVAGTKVYDTNLIFSRVVGLQASSRDINIHSNLDHELAPVPTSMFDDTGEMRIGQTKSVLKKQLQVEAGTRQSTSKVTCVVIDGSAVLYTIHWPSDGTVKDYKTNFKAYIGQKLNQNDVYLVFDRYHDFSIKSVTRSGRQANVSKVYQLTVDMAIPPQNVTLGVTENKKQLISLICSDLVSDTDFHQLHTNNHKLILTGESDVPIQVHKGIVIDRADLKTTHEEAGIILIQHIVDSLSEHSGISVISDDTDVFVLLVYFYVALELTSFVIMESPVRERAIIDVQQTAHKHRGIARDLLAAHALSGCDTVAGYFGIGKGKVIKALQAGHSLKLLGDQSSDMEDIVHESTKFVSACFGQNNCDDMSVTRQKLWAAKVGKCSKSMPPLSSLPPTKEAFRENVKRAHLQACTWRSALEQDPPDMDPQDYGWRRNENMKTLTPVTLSPNVPLAPPEVLQIIKCGCVSDNPCSTQRCSCTQARLPCTLFCACQRLSEDQCNNEQTYNA